MRALPFLVLVPLLVVATIAWLVRATDVAAEPDAAQATSTSRASRPADRGDELLAAADAGPRARVEAPVSAAPVSKASRRAERAADGGKAILRGRVELGGVRESRGLWARLREPSSRPVPADAASLHRRLRSRERHPEYVPVKACRFELVAPPGPHVVEILALGSAEPVYVSPPLEAIRGDQGAHPELDGIDLRGRVQLVSFVARDASTRSDVRRAVAYLAGNYPLDAEKRYVAAVGDLEALVEAPGYLGLVSRVSRSRPTAWMHRAAELELALDPSFATPPAGARVELEVRLVRRAHDRFASGTSGVEPARLALEGRSARFRLCVEGEYEVRFLSRFESRAKQSAAAFPGASTVHLTRELAGSPVVVAPLAPAYESWIASLR